MNSSLDDFLKRFGDNDPNKKMVQDGTRSKYYIESSQELQDQANKMETNKWLPSSTNLLKKKDTIKEAGEFAEQTWGENIDTPEGPSSPANIEKVGLAQKFSNENLSQGKGLLATKQMGAGDYAEVAMGGMELINNAKGGQFDTGADSGGPGKAGGAIMSGAATGFKAGMATGNPFIALGGAATGGLISTFAHKGAMKEWRKNQVKANLKENELESAKRSNQFAMEEGLASMKALKGLRQKQLGIYNS